RFVISFDIIQRAKKLLSSERGDVLLCWGSHHSLILYCLSIIHCVDTKSVPAVDSPARPRRSPVVQSICSELGRLFKRTGNQNPKLIGWDNFFTNLLPRLSRIDF